ncbi:ABC transporter permease [Egicoccus sp. AB-alg2]|uniref:ABC transporter permease n=1 Tax=Egicoccus sp. AB-alg2 TaxID=3242693 RepID=UPI00359ED3B9
MSTTTPFSPAGYDVDAIVRVAVASDDRPAPPSATTTSLTFAWRALLKIRHVPEQLLDVTVFPVMFLLMFTYLFGGAVAGSTGAYLQEVVPGILVMQVAWISMYTGHTLNRDITKGVHDRFRSLPIWRPATLVGPLLADTVRYTMASTVILGLGWALGFRPQAGATGLVLGIAVLLVFSFSLSWIWTTAGLLLRSENAVFSVGNMVMFPLTFVSNVFVPTETLPGWLQGFVAVNPISLVVTSVRGFVHGSPDLRATGLVLVISAALVAVFGPLTMRLYRHPR